MHTEPQRPSARATAWGGIAFAILYVAGVMTMFAGTPDDTNIDRPARYTADWVKYYADSGNRTTALIGAYLLVAAGIAAVVFGAHLRERLGAAGAGGSGRIAFAGTIMLGTLTIVAAVAVAWIPGAVAFGDVPAPQGELAGFAAQLGFGALLVGGGMTGALVLMAAGIGSIRTGALPKWLAWAGIVVAVIVGALGAFFVPMLLLVLWMLVAGIVGLRRPFAGEAATAA